MDNKPINNYDRKKALNYANRWALARNPGYYDFSNLGGDCTNFCSQVLHAGGCNMNYESNGWYYKDGNNKSPSWTGVNFLYEFLIRSKDFGPVAYEVNVRDIKIGDIIQLSFQTGNLYNHSLIVVSHGIYANVSNIKVSTHTDDRYHYPLINYKWTKIRFLHIINN